jgi:DhnA family fructose-bisphosphate aldolase class Ia
MSIANLTATPSTLASSASAAGNTYRLGRIFAGDGRTMILPVDHGTMAGLEDPVALIQSFLPLPASRW